jgi:hypothetical protein
MDLQLNQIHTKVDGADEKCLSTPGRSLERCNRQSVYIEFKLRSTKKFCGWAALKEHIRLKKRAVSTRLTVAS